VRTRITVAVALLVAVALTGAGVIVYAIEMQRIEQQVVNQVEQELAEFATLQKDGIDPETRERFVSVQGLLITFLARNVPDDSELFVAWWDGEPKKIFPPDEEDQDLTENSQPFRDAVAPLVGVNGSTRIDTDSHGELLITVQTVSLRSTDEQGALVVVTFLDRTRAGLYDTMQTYAIVAALSFILVTAIAGWQSGRLLAPLRVLREAAQEIGETDLSRRLPVTGNDDITALTKTVNNMLDRLEHAFVAQREFLDDAGHELRTPLTIVRGHLELVDEGNPEEVAETKTLLLDELDRMARLVGDLILLAKSDRPDFLTTQPVSLERFTHTVLAKARGLGERSWQLDTAGEAIVPMDEQRITQAVLQLADNAVKHTHDGDEIAIGSSHSLGWVRLWVRDTGPGVPEAEQRQIFERFGRAAVKPGDEGFGLGLSIVRAIAEAHRGRVAVENGTPRGATFVVTLPTAQETTWPTS